MRTLISLSTVLLLAAVASADVPAIPATPAAVDDVVYARTFTLEQGYKFEWRKDQPLVKQGTILVLKVDPDLVYARQVAEPVLYVGDTTAERINVGYGSGRVIAIVPGKVDLSKSPIWFGTPELPERVDAAMIKSERSAAQKAGIKPFSKKQITAAVGKGGAARLEVADRYELHRQLAPLVQEYSSDESELAESMLVPRNE
jgi:hypothetical protein